MKKTNRQGYNGFLPAVAILSKWSGFGGEIRDPAALMILTTNRHFSSKLGTNVFPMKSIQNVYFGLLHISYTIEATQGNVNLGSRKTGLVLEILAVSHNTSDQSLLLHTLHRD